MKNLIKLMTVTMILLLALAFFACDLNGGDEGTPTPSPSPSATPDGTPGVTPPPGPADASVWSLYSERDFSEIAATVNDTAAMVENDANGSGGFGPQLLFNAGRGSVRKIGALYEGEDPDDPEKPGNANMGYPSDDSADGGTECREFLPGPNSSNFQAILFNASPTGEDENEANVYDGTTVDLSSYDGGALHLQIKFANITDVSKYTINGEAMTEENAVDITDRDAATWEQDNGDGTWRILSDARLVMGNFQFNNVPFDYTDNIPRSNAEPSKIDLAAAINNWMTITTVLDFGSKEDISGNPIDFSEIEAFRNDATNFAKSWQGYYLMYMDDIFIMDADAYLNYQAQE